MEFICYMQIAYKTSNSHSRAAVKTSTKTKYKAEFRGTAIYVDF